MKFYLLIFSLLLCACKGGSDGSAAGRSADPVPDEIIKSCALNDALGAWNTGLSNDGDLTLNDDCTIRINQCGTTYEITNVVPDSFDDTDVTLKVTSYDFVQDGCLRPAVGDFQCRINVFFDSGLNKNVFNLSCADENFYHTSVSYNWLRN